MRTTGDTQQEEGKGDEKQQTRRAAVSNPEQDRELTEITSMLQTLVNDMTAVKQDLRDARRDIKQTNERLDRGFDQVDKRLGFLQTVIIANLTIMGTMLVAVISAVISIVLKVFGILG